ncbi:hypothetical protein MTO96_035211 [Rhipicephalus appendiculatus]
MSSGGPIVRTAFASNGGGGAASAARNGVRSAGSVRTGHGVSGGGGYPPWRRVSGDFCLDLAREDRHAADVVVKPRCNSATAAHRARDVDEFYLRVTKRQEEHLIPLKEDLADWLNKSLGSGSRTRWPDRVHTHILKRSEIESVHILQPG